MDAGCAMVYWAEAIGYIAHLPICPPPIDFLARLPWCGH